MNILLGTDLDRTLLHNGIQEYDGSMPEFKKIVDENKICLVFVTGRNLDLVKQAMEEFDLPQPEYVIGDVGTRIYSQDFVLDEKWISLVKKKTNSWDIKKFQEAIQDMNIRIQEPEKQNELKLSYYIDDTARCATVNQEICKRIAKISQDAVVVFSLDEKNDIGLIDILPKCATKLDALEYLRKKLGYEKDEVIYAGDSGNDFSALTSGYKAILVKNAIEEVKNAVKKKLQEKKQIEKLYLAKGNEKLNGYYVSGIIEGLQAMKVIRK